MYRILIKNVGPIRECEFEVKPINIFIGPQATGKSTIAKLIHISKSIYGFLVLSIPEALRENEPFGVAFEKVLKKNFRIPTTYFEENSEVVFNFTEKLWIKSCYKGGKLSLVFSEEFKKRLEEANNIVDSSRKESGLLEGTVGIAILITEIKNLFQEIYQGELPVFIPAGRLIYSFIPSRSAFFTMSFEPMLEDFNWIRELMVRELFGEKEQVSVSEDVIKEILKAKISFDDEKGIIKLVVGNEKEFPLRFVSSGQQEVLWILLVVQFLLKSKRHSFVVIEEPEAHLFPATQKKVVEILSLLHNITGSGLVITTHSPYILTSFNNLLYAYKVASETGKEEEVSKVINRELWINPDEVNAFYVDNGKIEDILDDEFKTIKAEVIDQISNEINKEFDVLLDIEVENEL